MRAKNSKTTNGNPELIEALEAIAREKVSARRYYWKPSRILFWQLAKTSLVNRITFVWF